MILTKLVPPETSQLPRSWSKTEASLNIESWDEKNNGKHGWLRAPILQKQQTSGFDLIWFRIQLGNSAINWNTIVDTYKKNSLGDVPATEVLIKGRGPRKHITLRWENNWKYNWLRGYFIQKSHIRLREGCFWFQLRNSSKQVHCIHSNQTPPWLILTKLVPLERSQLPRSWSKTEAPSNIEDWDERLMENIIGWECLFFQRQHTSGFNLILNPTLEQSKTSSMYSLQSENTLVDTYKACTPGDIPATKVLIKGRSPLKHRILRWENNGKHGWLRAPVPSKATHIMIQFDSESNQTPP
jgi:hypothetical protein